MKRFGYHANQLYFNMRAPSKLQYVKTKRQGYWEIPKAKSTTNANELYRNFEKRVEFEKYMNPKGLKPTVTSRFAKPPTEIEFVSHDFMLSRSAKPYQKNQVSFRCSPYLSKPEIKQYLSKVYNLPVQKVDTANKMGTIKINRENNTKWRKKNWKKAIVSVGYEVDYELKHFD